MRQRIPLMYTFCWVEQDAKVNIFPFLVILNLGYACALRNEMTDGIAGPDADFSPERYSNAFYRISICTFSKSFNAFIGSTL